MSRALALGAVLLALAGCASSALRPAVATPETGRAYLEANADRRGVTVTASGLQVRMLRAARGEGATPTAADTVRVHYEGRLVDGTVFDSSYTRGEPAEFPLGAVIRGWTEGLQRMRPGEVAELVIPAELGYGARGAGGVIPPNAVLVFKVELLGFTRPDGTVVSAPSGGGR